MSSFAADCGIELARRRVTAVVFVDRRWGPVGAWRRLLRGRCRFSFLGTVYLIRISEDTDQVLPFAVAACHTLR